MHVFQVNTPYKQCNVNKRMDFLNYQVSLIFIETYNQVDTSIRAVILVDDL